MADIDIVEQKPIAMVELKIKLDQMKKDKGELNFRAERVYAYLLEFMTKKKTDGIYQKLSALDIIKLRDRHIVKILDVMPEDAESVKILFSGETTSLKQEEIQKIVEIVNG